MTKINYKVCIYKDANLYIALPFVHNITWPDEQTKEDAYQIRLSVSKTEVWAVYYMEANGYPIHVLLPDELFHRDFKVLGDLNG